MSTKVIAAPILVEMSDDENPALTPSEYSIAAALLCDRKWKARMIAKEIADARAAVRENVSRMGLDVAIGELRELIHAGQYGMAREWFVEILYIESLKTRNHI